MIEYNNGMPVYWRNESSGKLEEAVNAYWMPYANLSSDIPDRVCQSCKFAQAIHSTLGYCSLLEKQSIFRRRHRSRIR